MAEFKGSSSDAFRVRRLDQQRVEQQKKFEETKGKMIAEAQVGIKKIDEMFASHTDSLEVQFKKQTVGLVTAEDFARKRLELEVMQHKLQQARSEEKEQNKRAKEKKAQKRSAKLSFDLEEEENGEEDKKEEKETVAAKKPRSQKNPHVDTSFLPDKDRDEQEKKERLQLAEEWKAEQERIKSELIEVTYSYWDGSGHRRSIQVKKGCTIDYFLEMARRQVCDEFSELRVLNSENLLYIKEDLIIPHHYTFYDFIISKARGKSGPLFHFDVHDDVRLLADARVEKDESHAGKVVTRSFYEKNKHIFPYSRWEVYDPAKKYERYTIHGD